MDVFDVVMHTIAWWSIGSTIAGWVRVHRHPKVPDIELIDVEPTGFRKMNLRLRCRLCDATWRFRNHTWGEDEHFTCCACGAEADLKKIQKALRQALRSEPVTKREDEGPLRDDTETIH